MKGKISLPGVLLGALAALAAGLLVSHYSFAWMVVGFGLGTVLGMAMRRNRADSILSKGEQR